MKGYSAEAAATATVLAVAICSLALLPQIAEAQSQGVVVVYPFILGATKCVSCGTGNFSNASASGTCEACPPGSYNPYNESGTCTPCPNKTYAPYRSMAACLPCDTAMGSGYSTCPGPTVPVEFFGTRLPSFRNVLVNVSKLSTSSKNTRRAHHPKTHARTTVRNTENNTTLASNSPNYAVRRNDKEGGAYAFFAEKCHPCLVIRLQIDFSLQNGFSVAKWIFHAKIDFSLLYPWHWGLNDGNSRKIEFQQE